MKTAVYEALITNMPAGIDRGIMSVLRFHVGKERAIQKGEILEGMKRMGYYCHERQFRERIHELRRQGWLIASLSADGYYLVANKIEYSEFRESEFTARIDDLSITRSAMDTAARQQFGEAVQVGLL